MNKAKVFTFLLGTLLLLTTESFAFDKGKVVDDECFKQVLDVVDISTSDIKNYKNAFKYIREGNFSKLEECIEDIDNDMLMGHVLAEKYLSKGYDTSFQELKEWLSDYSGHPQTKSIYNLALKKKKDTDVVPLVDGAEKIKYYSPYSWYNEDYEKLRPKHAKYLRQQVNNFRKYINTGKTRKARMILEDNTFRMRVPNRNYDAMSATLALVYFLDNEDKLALAWVEKAVRRSKDATAAWVGGLAAWRLKKYKTSASYFSKLATLNDNDEWLVAAGGYWGYRAYMKQGNLVEANKMLAAASRYNRTFYGILAAHKLGLPIEYNWEITAYYNDFSKCDYIEELLTSEPMRRALLLIYAKNPGLAEKELRAHYKNMAETQQELALYIARQYDMHFLAIELANYLRKEGVSYDHIAYPVPNFKPKGGWKVDKALVWALVRQESAFSPSAISGAGALGLMQLMPRTAYHVTKEKNSGALMDASYNLQVGQKYVNYLMEKPFIDGNLFFLATAYNAGPGNLVKWQKKTKYGNDPLMFIEAIPSRETRIYIERVMANYWIYNMRFNKANPTLEQVAADKWPRDGGREADSD